MTDEEAAELEAALARKRDVAQPIINEYNAVYRKFKTRCDAQMRRAKDGKTEEQ